MLAQPTWDSSQAWSSEAEVFQPQACVQVLAPGGELCTARVLHRPQPLPPAAAYALLGRNQPQMLRQAALAGLWSMQLLRRGLAAFDRANASGIEDTVLVRCGSFRLWCK